MYCTKCGSYNPDDANNCAACGAPLHQTNPNQPVGPSVPNNSPNNPYPPNYPPVNQNVPNYLVFSILVTIFCCLPLGIVAIINSTNVDKKLRMGDYNGALAASKNAKMFCLISLVAGIIIEAIYFFVVLAQM